MKSKKRTSVLLLCVLAVLCIVFAFTFAACKKSDSKTVIEPAIDYDDELILDPDDSGDGYEITGTTNEACEEIVIPDKFNGIPITKIGEEAFRDCTSLTSITIPEPVTSLGDYAFYGCTALTSIHFNAVKMDDLSLDNRTFRLAGTSGDGITVTIGKNVTKIPARLFYPFDDNFAQPEAPNITTVLFEEKSKCASIGENAFEQCRSITSIDIPEGVTLIDKGAFFLCWSLTSVTIPSTLTTLGDSAFGACSALTSITIPDSVTTMRDRVFNGCGALTSVTIGKNVTSIGVQTFYDCTSLTSIVIPDSVASIGNIAFYGCTSLTSVTVGSGVATIDNSAFGDCASIETVYYNGSSSDWAEISIGDNNEFFTSATIYYYSGTEPSGDGNFWHYVDGEIVVWTKKEN